MAEGAGAPLTPDEARLALERIGLWRAGGGTPVPCPRCNREGVSITDRSARPYAEWYAFSCAACGLEATLHIPMSPPPSL